LGKRIKNYAQFLKRCDLLFLHHSFLKMKAKNDKTDLSATKKIRMKQKNLSGYQRYPASEDIYSKYVEEREINPEDISKTKESDYGDEENDEKDFDDNFSGSDLDVPGAELDDFQENIGSEDEENNYYSLGGDDHNSLEEDN